MLSLFPFQALEKLDLDILEFWLFYRIVYFGVVFDLVYVGIFKIQSLSDQVLGRFIQYENFYVVGRVNGNIDTTWRIDKILKLYRNIYSFIDVPG